MNDTDDTDQVSVDSADEMLVAALRTWLTSKHVGSNKRAATAVWRWMGAKGLDLP